MRAHRRSVLDSTSVELRCLDRHRGKHFIARLSSTCVESRCVRGALDGRDLTGHESS